MKYLINIIIFLTAFAFFYVFRPYSFIDHSKSYIVCKKNEAKYPLGATFFYIFDRVPDTLTDKNIRKLCEYSIINDYQDSYQTPTDLNYRLELVYTQEGSWGDTVLISLGIFLLMSILFSKLGKLINPNFQFPTNEPDQRSVHGPEPNESSGSRVSKQISNFKISNLLISVFGLIFLIILLYKPAKHLYCERQIAAKINNFKKSAYGYGLFRIQQEEIRIKPVLDQAFKKCVQ